jgi:hypothetical protein
MELLPFTKFEQSHLRMLVSQYTRKTPDSRPNTSIVVRLYLLYSQTTPDPVSSPYHTDRPVRPAIILIQPLGERYTSMSYVLNRISPSGRLCGPDRSV